VSDEYSPNPARHRGRVRRTHTMGRAVLTCIVAVTMLIGLGSTFFYRHLNENITFLNIDDKIGDRPDKVAPGDPINVLIMGSDSRGGDEGVDQMENGGARSDTTILMHLSSNRKFAYGISLPRDALVDRPECDTDDGPVAAEDNVMFNTAFYYGGVACTVKTVESLTKVKIDHWVVVNFNGFKDMVDAIGGVEVCVPEAVDDDRYNMHLEAGTQKIKGDDALQYVRVRHGLGDGSDIGRMKRQQAFIASMAAQVVSAGTLTRVDRLVKFLNAATASLALDTGVGNVMSLAQLGNQFRGIGLEHIKFLTVPWMYYPEDPNRVIWKEKESKALWKRVREDKPLVKEFLDGAISAAKQPGAHSPKHHGQKSPTKTPTVDPDKAEQAEADGLCA